MKVQRVLVVAVVLLFLVSLGFGQTKGRTEHFEFTHHATNSYFGSCGDFAVIADYVVMVSGVAVLDEDGGYVRQVGHTRILGQSIFYNSNDNDYFLSGGPGQVATQVWDFENGLILTAGIPWKIKVPGYGSVLFETGRLVCDLNTLECTANTGQNQFFEGDLEAVCKLLTPLP
jgi:hypothetical protein